MKQTLAHRVGLLPTILLPDKPHRVCFAALAFPHNLPRRFIFPQPDKLRVPQVPIRRPFGELDLGD
jgi:hypothetical protein